MKFWILLAGGLSAFPAVAQEGTDPRALQACQEESSDFVEISECLPNAHVAVKVLDTFEAAYSSEAQPLRLRCIELNEIISGQSTCLMQGIQSALALKESLPVGGALDDPLFEALVDQSKYDALQKTIEDARSLFPDQSYWGGGSYYPYSAPKEPVLDDSLGNALGDIINGT